MPTQKDLAYYFTKAKQEKFAIPQFNFSDFTQLKAIAETCARLKSPAILGTSEGESKFFGLDEAVALRDVLRKKTGAAIFLNLDHGKSVEYLKQAIDAGYDMVHFDGSKLAFDENIKISKEVAAMAKAKGVLIEGEMGRIGTDASRVYTEKFQINEEFLTKPEEAKRYADETGVDVLAISIGNFHGVDASGESEHLRLPLLEEIQTILSGKTGLVLHGGSGTSKEDIQGAIQRGIVKININTESRMAFTGALRKFLADNPAEIVPYKFLADPKKAMEEVLERKISEFLSQGKA